MQSFQAVAVLAFVAGLVAAAPVPSDAEYKRDSAYTNGGEASSALWLVDDEQVEKRTLYPNIALKTVKDKEKRDSAYTNGGESSSALWLVDDEKLEKRIYYPSVALKTVEDKEKRDSAYTNGGESSSALWLVDDEKLEG